MPEESRQSPQPMDEGRSELSQSNNCSQDHVEIIPTRSTKIPTSKPPTNPLQFVKVGPAALYKSAQDQIKKVEVVKKVKEEVKEETTDWQSNLDNWKCSRRKRQEHIIERVVEVKKLELDEFDKNGRKNKTFSEMMEERSSKGRKCPGIPVYDDDSNDLSDLGLSVSSSSNNNENGMSNVEDTEDIPPDKPEFENSPDVNKSTDLLDSGSNASCTETKVKTRTIQSSKSQPSLYSSRRNSMNIEQKINECTSNSHSSTSNKKPIVLPKIDINSRKNLFENAKINEEDSKLRKSVSSGNISKPKSIKDRLSMFGKPEEPVNPKIDKVFLPKVSVKERLSSIERQNSVENSFSAKSVEDFKSSQIIKQSLSSRSDSNKTSESPNPTPIMENEFNKEQDSRQECRMNEVESVTNSASHCNYYDEQTISEYSEAKIKPSDPEPESQPDNIYNTDSSEKCLSSDDEYRNNCTKHFRHRSLDSLNSDSKFDSSPFARVQSFEELDFRDRGNYPASSLSGDTDREDSGIHTADVSSCVSQSDDCDTMSMGEMDMHHLEATNLSVIPEAEVQQEPVVAIACQYDTMSSKLIDLEIENHTQSNVAVNELKEDLVEHANSVPDHAENCSDQSNCDNPQLELSSSESPVIKETDTPTVSLAEVSETNELEDLSKMEKPIEVEEPKKAVDDVFASRQSPEKATPLFSSDLIVPNLDFHLDLNLSEVTREPPKEPPPPPPGLSDEEEEDDHLSQETHSVQSDTSKSSSLKRNDSTKRLKREIHLKRSSFLGIDGSNAEDYLEAELRVKSPVDVVGLLANELQYRYSDYQFAYEKEERNNNNNNEDFGFEKLTTPGEKYFYGNLVEDKSNSYLHRQSVCSGDSGVASPSSTPQPQLDQEFHFGPPEQYHDTNHQRIDDSNNFNKTSPKHHNGTSSNNYNNVSPKKTQEALPVKKDHFNKEIPYQNSQYYNEQDRNQHLVDRNQNMYNNYNGDHSSTNGNHAQNEQYYANTQKIQQYNEQNRSKHDKEHYNEIRDNCVKNGPVNADRHIVYNQYNLDAIQYNNHEDMYKQDYYNNSKDVYQNAEMYLSPDFKKNQEYYPEKYPQYGNNYNGEVEKKLINYKDDSHYKDIVNGNYYSNYNELEHPNVMRRSLQDITHKSIALYENTSSFQDDYREPHKLKEISRQQKAIPAGGRSMPNLKEIKYRAASQPIPSQSAQRRPSPSEPYLNHSVSSSRIPKSSASSNENGNVAKRKSKQYNYNTHWLIQEAEHRRIVEQQQRKSLPLQTTSTKLTNEVKSNNVNINRTNIAQNNKIWNNATQSSSNGIMSSSNGIMSSSNGIMSSSNGKDKGLPDAIIENLTRRVQHKLTAPLRRPDEYESKVQVPVQGIPATNLQPVPNSNSFQYYNRDKMLSVSGKNKCSFCNEELGRGAAMIIESLHLFYHIHCFKCSVCCIQLGDGLMGTDVRVRNNKLHCQNCYSNDDGVKFSCV